MEEGNINNIRRWTALNLEDAIVAIMKNDQTTTTPRIRKPRDAGSPHHRKKFAHTYTYTRYHVITVNEPCSWLVFASGKQEKIEKNCKREENAVICINTHTYTDTEI